MSARDSKCFWLSIEEEDTVPLIDSTIEEKKMTPANSGTRMEDKFGMNKENVYRRNRGNFSNSLIGSKIMFASRSNVFFYLPSSHNMARHVYISIAKPTAKNNEDNKLRINHWQL